MAPEKCGLLAVPRDILKFDMVCYLHIAQVLSWADSQAKPYVLCKVLGNLRTSYEAYPESKDTSRADR